MARRDRIPFGRTYYLTVRLTSDGVLAYEPPVVTFKLRKPDGTLTTYALSDNTVDTLGDGRYRIVFSADQDGLWRYSIEGRDINFEAILDPPGEIIVERSGV